MIALIRNPPLLLFVEVLGLAGGLAMVGAVTISGWVAHCPSSSPSSRMAYGDPRRWAARPGLPDATIKLVQALRYGETFSTATWA